MTITISTNISASIAQAAMTRNSRELDSAMEKLSTGKKINSAADNASGLAITTRLTTEIRKLTQVMANASDFISMMDVADGALIEIEVMLQRMRQLAVQSGTGTTSSADRSHMNREFASLRTEIDRIAKNTAWNGRDKLLAGEAGTASPYEIGPQAKVIFINSFNEGRTYSGPDAFSTPFGNFSEDNDTSGMGGFSWPGGDHPGAPALSGLVSKTLSTGTISSAVAVSSSVLVEVDSVLSKVGRQRHMFGATTNRLTHMVDNLMNSVTNLQSSRSRILDTDYASTTAELAKRQILQQAGMAMIAQANALPQTVMMLLSD